MEELPDARRPAPLLGVPIARLVAFALLGSVGALQWARLVETLPAARVLSWVALGVASAGAVLACERLPGRRRDVALAAVALAALLAAWVAAGLDLGLLRRSRWPELGDGLARGTEALGTVALPYSGQDPWPALVLQLLGALLCVLAGLLALWPRGRPAGARGYPYFALAALLTLSATPVISIGSARQLLLGLVLAALSIAFLWLERLPLRPGLGLAGLLGLALAGALPLATMADREDPWFDYKAFAEGIGPEDPVTFDWEHSDYGPIDWPRAGVEVLRVSGRRPAYWKVATLSDFDGTAWRDRGAASADPEADLPPDWRSRSVWTRTVRVSVRRLREEELAAPGTITRVLGSSRRVYPGDEPGVQRAFGGLRPGDSYTVRAYVPQPALPRLAAASTPWQGNQRDELELSLPLAGVDYVPAAAAEVPTPAAGTPAPPLSRRLGRGARRFRSPFAGGRADYTVLSFRAFALGPPQATAAFPELDVSEDGAGVLRALGYDRVWRLARRLRRGTTTPLEYILAVNRHLQDGFVYTEQPEPVPSGARPLDWFLFHTRAGYCQHFSAAMALLLRMGGVPARVATGFTAGGFSKRKNAWIVRDTDAHSWVEAWFDDLGWVTFDPTPSETPARSQIAALEPAAEDGDAAAGGQASPTPSAANPALRTEPVGATSSGSSGDDAAADGGVAWRLPAAGALAAVLAAVALLRRRRRGRPRPGTPQERALVDLERALRGSGRAVPPGTTLRDIERRLHLTPAAAGYLQALSAARYAGPGRDARVPTREQRRALRRELGKGLGLRGRLRLLAALPPRR